MVTRKISQSHLFYLIIKTKNYGNRDIIILFVDDNQLINFLTDVVFQSNDPEINIEDINQPFSNILNQIATNEQLKNFINLRNSNKINYNKTIVSLNDDLRRINRKET